MLKKILMGAAGLVMLSTASASAYTITVQEFTTGGVGFDAHQFNTTSVCPTTTEACAKFDYSGPLNFDNGAGQNSDQTGDLNSNFFIAGDISNYSGSGTVSYLGTQVANFGSGTGALSTSDANFLASSGSASSFKYGSLYGIDLGTIYAGTLISITHDDGVCVYENGGCLAGFTVGATSAVTESENLALSGDVTLYYTRQNGTPSILQVTVPEPASIAVFGAALICMAGMAGWMRRSRSSV